MPTAILTTAITVTIFPYLSAAMQKKKGEAKKIIHKSLLFSLLLGFMVIVFALPVLVYFAQNPFSIGNLGEHALSIICISVAIAILSIPAKVFNYNIITLMHANKNTRVPTYINTVISLLMIPFIWVLSNYEHYGVFIGLTLTHWLMVPFYYWQLKKYMLNNAN